MGGVVGGVVGLGRVGGVMIAQGPGANNTPNNGGLVRPTPLGPRRLPSRVLKIYIFLYTLLSARYGVGRTMPVLFGVLLPPMSHALARHAAHSLIFVTYRLTLC